MGSEWGQARLGDLLEITSSKRIFRADYCDDGVPFYRGKEIVELSKGNTISTELFISSEKFEEIKAKFGAPVAGDLLLTSVGTLGAVYLVRNGDRFYFKDGNLTWFRNFSDKLLPSFLHQWFRSPIAKREIDKITIGSTQQALTIVSLKSIVLDVPPIEEQKKITEILSSLDNKIALNRQINTTLESMAQALFKSWFVDFDPVIDNALAAGNEIPDELAARAARREALRQQTSKTTATTDAANSEQALPDTGLSDQRLPCEIQQLFPDRFVLTEEMGWVPEGWEVTKVAELMDLSYGKSLSATKRVEGTVPVYGSGGVSGYHNEHLVNGPGIIVGRKGTVGSLYWVEDDFFPIDTVFFVENKTELPLYWLYQTLGTLNIAGMGADSAVPGVNRNTVYACSVVVPTENVTKSYGALIDSLNSKKESLRLQERDLADLRDSLLPKLLSGQITLPDAEQQLAEVL